MTSSVSTPFVFDDADRAVVERLLAAHRDVPGGLLPLLHAVQDAFGHVPDAVVPDVARAFNLSRAEVHGVVTYYHFFRRARAGRHVVQICRAESCKAVGADALVAHAESVLGCAMHATRPDGAVTLEPVYCLGLCATSPAMTIDDKPYARMSLARLDRLVAGLGISA